MTDSTPAVASIYGKDGRSPSHATVVAYLALFVAVATGGAYAAEQIGSDDIEADAVKSRHVADQTIRNRHLRPGNVTSESIAQGAIGGNNVGANTLTGQNIDEATLDLPPGQEGPQGPKGEQGVPGPPGPPGITGANGSDAASFQAARIEGLATFAPFQCGAISGTSSADVNCSSEMISPPANITAVNMGVRLDFAAPADSIFVVLLVDDLLTPLACVVPPGLDTCQIAGAVPIAANSRLEWQIFSGTTIFDPGDAVEVTWQATAS